MPHILITGVSTGIGRAVAKLYAQRGWRVTGTVRDAQKSRPDGLPRVIALESLDLSVPGSAGLLAARVLVDHGRPDVLLSNAGIVQFGALEDVSSEDLARIFQVNLFGQHALIRALLPAMRERDSGTIANVASAARSTAPSCAPCSPSSQRSRTAPRPRPAQERSHAPSMTRAIAYATRWRLTRAQ